MVRILLADNDSSFLETRAEFLEDVGYQVLTATNPDETIRQLRSGRVQLAILDVRLEDDDESRDASGVELALDPRFRSIPKIIVTRFPKVLDQNRVMSVNPDRTQYVASYLDKEDGPQVLIDKVKEVLSKQVPICWDQKWRWVDPCGPSSFPELAGQFILEAEIPRLADLGEEMNDLFRRLFKPYNQVTIYRQLSRQPQRAVLLVKGYREAGNRGGAGEHFMLTIGGVEALREERGIFHRDLTKPVQDTLFDLIDGQDAERFGANLWDLGHCSVEDVLTLKECASLHKIDLAMLAVKNLAEHTLPAWQARNMPPENGLMPGTFYRSQLGLTEKHLSSEHFLAVAAQLASEAQDLGLLVSVEVGAQVIRVTLSGRLREETIHDLTLPLIDETLAWPPGTCWSLAVGALESSNFLVDEKGNAWLTQIQPLCSAPCWWNSVLLETVGLFDIRLGGELDVLREMEEQTWKTGPLDAILPVKGKSGSERRQVEAIQMVHRQVAKFAGRDPTPYYIALHYATLADVLKFDPNIHHTREELHRLLHRLLFAKQLATMIEESQIGDFSKPLASRALSPLVVDEKRRMVSAGGKELNLSRTEFDLLLYLHKNRHRVCTAKEIYDHFFPDARETSSTGKWVYTNISRLRQALMDERYVKTHPNRGYSMAAEPMADQSQ